MVNLGCVLCNQLPVSRWIDMVIEFATVHITTSTMNIFVMKAYFSFLS